MTEPKEPEALEPDQLASWQDDGGARIVGSCVPNSTDPTEIYRRAVVTGSMRKCMRGTYEMP